MNKQNYTEMPITPVILCGGSGTRLWPLSRKMYPKPFVKRSSGSTLFSDTFDRAKHIGRPPF